jgi:heme-degrading monooxygenase HmoA
VVSKDNNVTTVMAIFPTEPEEQQGLVDTIRDFTLAAMRPQPGFISSTIHRSLDGLRVINYAQWKTQEEYFAFIKNAEVKVKAAKLSEFPKPDLHLYEIFISAPTGSEIALSPDTEGLINFGIFKMRNLANQAHFMELAKEAVALVAGQTGLVSTHFHRSIAGEGAYCVNYGLWKTQAEYAAMVDDPPFVEPIVEMLELADNEFQKSLYKIVFTESAS